MLPTMKGLGEDAMYISQGVLPMSTEVMLRIIKAREVRSYLMVWSTSRRIGVPTEKLLCKYIDPVGLRYLILASLNNIIHQVNSRSLLSPCFAVFVYV